MKTAVTVRMPFDDDKMARTELASSLATCFVFNRTRRGQVAYTALFRIRLFLRARLANDPVPGFVKRALG